MDCTRYCNQMCCFCPSVFLYLLHLFFYFLTFLLVISIAAREWNLILMYCNSLFLIYMFSRIFLTLLQQLPRLLLLLLLTLAGLCWKRSQAEIRQSFWRTCHSMECLSMESPPRDPTDASCRITTRSPSGTPPRNVSVPRV